MKAETPELARAALLGLGFYDTSDEHPWNDPSMEREFGELGHLTVWGRNRELNVQWYQCDDMLVQFLSTEDIDAMKATVIAAIAFLNRLQEIKKGAIG